LSHGGGELPRAKHLSLRERKASNRGVAHLNLLPLYLFCTLPAQANVSAERWPSPSPLAGMTLRAKASKAPTHSTARGATTRQRYALASTGAARAATERAVRRPASRLCRCRHSRQRCLAFWADWAGYGEQHLALACPYQGSDTMRFGLSPSGRDFTLKQTFGTSRYGTNTPSNIYAQQLAVRCAPAPLKAAALARGC